MLRSLVNILSLVLMAVAAVLLLGFTAVPSALGYKSYVVLSGSMEPAIHTGAVVIASPVSPSTLKVGDVIVYNRSDVNERVTHRIVDVQDEGSNPTFTTKGDANGAPDSWTVQYAQGTAGKVVFSIPYVGYLNSALESPQGRLLFVIVPVVVLAGMWLVQIWRPKQAPAAASTASVASATPAEMPVSRLVPVNLNAGASDTSASLPLRQ